ncbi:RNA polymerase [Aeromonas phage 1233]|nr:RNA polymerase [Aeromonas phage 1233]
MRGYANIAALIEQEFDDNTIQALTDESMDNIKLIRANVEIENRMRALGFEKYIERQKGLKDKGAVLDTDIALKKVMEELKPLAEAIKATVDNYKGKKPHIAVEVFKRHDPFSLAVHTLRTFINRVTIDKPELASSVITMVSQIEPNLTEAECIRVGYKLMMLLCENSNGHFRIVTKATNGQQVRIMEFSEEFEQWERDNMAAMAELSVLYRPLVIPPRPWTGIRDGGFWAPELVHPFIRNNPKATNRTHGPRIIPEVYKAVNTIQATPFKINRFVLDVANAIGNRKDEYKNPLMFDGFFEAIPERPHKHKARDLAKRQEELYTELGVTEAIKAQGGFIKKFGQFVRDLMLRITDGPLYEKKVELEQVRFDLLQYVKWRKAVTSATSKNRVIRTALDVANEYVLFKAIYFPHSLDWRGRIYPMTAGLTTQGNGFQKGLLCFAEGKPLRTEEAAIWLKVHTANSFGMDKKSWQDRIKWTEDNQALIERVASNPVRYVEDWIHTDEPWLFLAACEQMTRYYKDGLDAVIDIAIPMDGTCNGAQHYAMMTRDTKGAYGVNVAPNGTQGLRERLEALRGQVKTDTCPISDWNLTRKLNDKLKALIGYQD